MQFERIDEANPDGIKSIYWLSALESSLFWIQASISSIDHLAEEPILAGSGNVPSLIHE